MDPTKELRERLNRARQRAHTLRRAHDTASQERATRLAQLNGLLGGGFDVLSLTDGGGPKAEQQLRQAYDAYSAAHTSYGQTSWTAIEADAAVLRLESELEKEKAKIRAEKQRKRKAERQPRQKTKARTKTARPQSPSPSPPTLWKELADGLLSSYTEMAIFPHPPARNCSKAACTSTKATRALQACSCDIRAAFQAICGLDPKKERLRWHPDRFSACPEQFREKFKKMAQEVFCVIDEMYQGR